MEISNPTNARYTLRLAFLFPSLLRLINSDMHNIWPKKKRKSLWYLFQTYPTPNIYYRYVRNLQPALWSKFTGYYSALCRHPSKSMKAVRQTTMRFLSVVPSSGVPDWGSFEVSQRAWSQVCWTVHVGDIVRISPASTDSNIIFSSAPPAYPDVPPQDVKC